MGCVSHVDENSSERTFGIMKRTMIFSMVVLAIGCTPQAGEGGKATIQGVIEQEIRAVITNPAGAQHVLAADYDVFITYGDRTGPDDKVVTNFDGEFSFYYLRPGSYTVYVYSEDTIPPFPGAPDVALIREIEIARGDESVDLGTIRVYKEN